MSFDIKYRKATNADLSEILAIYTEAIDAMIAEGNTQWDTKVYPTSIDIFWDVDAGNMYVGLIDGFIAVVYAIDTHVDEEYRNASWRVEDKYIVMHRLCVVCCMQNQGVARQAVEHIEAEALASGVKSIRLDAYVGNAYALKLYEHLGYQKRGEAGWRGNRFNLYEKLLGFGSVPNHVGMISKEIFGVSGTIISGSVAYLDSLGGGPVEKHTHSHNHLFIVSKGEARIEINDTVVILRENESYLVQGMYPHSIWNNTEGDSSVICINVC